MMKCTNENFRNVVFFNDTGHSAWSAAEWPCGAFRGMVEWTNTRKRICGDENLSSPFATLVMLGPNLLFCSD